MGIVNAAHCVADVYEEIDKELLQHVEDVLLNRSEEATEKMLDYAATLVRICRVCTRLRGFLLRAPCSTQASLLRLPETADAQADACELYMTPVHLHSHP